MGDFSHGKTHAAGHRTGSVRSLPGSSMHVCGNGAKIAAGIKPDQKLSPQLHLTHILIRIKRLCELPDIFRDKEWER